MVTFFSQIIANLRFADIFDVIVVTFLFYFLFSYLRRRASRSIILVVGAVLVLYLVAEKTTMYMTSLFFQAGLTAALVTIVIIFQDDLRKALERLASMESFYARRDLVASNTTVDSLIEALCNLARDKIGALIVVKGKEAIDRHLSGGIALNGRVSVPLLYSIFHPETPSHDGAVIIEGERIDRFGVRLPLSRNLAEVGSAGTRHTAALGISERTDALVLVVSEERGVISVAEAGHLEVVSREQLQNRLDNYYHRMSPPAKATTSYSWLFNNSGMKLLALLTTVVLWFFVAYRVDTISRTIAVPVEYRNVPSGWVLESAQPARVMVTLSGPERAFNFDASMVVASVNMDSIQEGSQSIPLTEKQLNLPASIKVNAITPDKCSFRAKLLEHVELPVRVRTLGKLPPELKLVEIKPQPASIMLIVPHTQRRFIKEVTTESVNLSTIEQSAVVQVAPVVPAGTQLEDQNMSSVRVVITVEKRK